MAAKSDAQSSPAPQGKDLVYDPNSPFDFWDNPVRIEPNNFQFKSLSTWSLNLSIGCSHGCRFCYVPSTSVNKQAAALARFGVTDPDGEWGEYSLLRPWDEAEFLKSLQKAEKTPLSQMKPDGNRAVLLCSTTDPFQLFHHPEPQKNKLLNESAINTVIKALELTAQLFFCKIFSHVKLRAGLGFPC